MSTCNKRVQFAATKIPYTVHFSAISKHGWKDSIVGGRINFSGGVKIAGTPRYHGQINDHKSFWRRNMLGH
jgi:hypothetical protein